jgi:hypothetical protein
VVDHLVHLVDIDLAGSVAGSRLLDMLESSESSLS